MILNFGNYIFDDGIRGINGEKPKMIQVLGSSTSMNGTKPVVTKGNIDVYQQYAFNESYYNDLLNRGKFQDAVDYISRYRPVNEEQRKVFDADVASLRQQARYENNFRSNLTEDQLNRYNFYNGVFQDRGLDYIRENPYVRQFEDIKRRIGSVTTFDKDGNLVVEQEAKGLKIFFPNTKRVNRWTSWLGHNISDALQADTHNGIDNFLEYSQLNKNDLLNAGINIEYDDTGSAYISFNKSNALANELIYKYYNFYTNNWDENELGYHWNPSIQGLDDNGNIINTAYIYDPTEDSKFYSNDWLYKGINSLVRRGEAGDYKTNRTVKNDMRSFASLISQNEQVSLALEEEAGLTEHDYSSIESSFMSDNMQNYLQFAKQRGLTQEQTLSGLKYIHAQDVELATKSLSQADKDFYTSYFNDNENDDTLVKREDPKEIEKIVDMLNEADPNDVNLSILVSNGIIGTKISLQKKPEKKGETVLGTNRALQVWVPGLFTEEAQKRLNEEPQSRAVLETNTILDTNSTYTLRGGSRITADSNDQFYIESGRIDEYGRAGYINRIPISKEQAAAEITKDLVIDDVIQSQFNEQISPSGNIISVEDYDLAAKKRAILAVQQKLYPGQNDLVKTDGTYITPEELFNKEINVNNVSPYVYNKVKAIYDIYDALMEELYGYEDFTEALLSIGQRRFNYSVNS